MIYVFIALLILVFSFLIALISLIRDSAKLENFNKAKVAESERPAEYSPEAVVQQAASGPESIPQAKSSPKPVETETVPFPWDQKGTTGPQSEEKKEEPLPWEAPDSGLGSVKGTLSGEISLRDLKKSS